MKNSEKITIENFGKEWKEFNQKDLSIIENKDMFEKYFKILPSNLINKDSIILDAGCGSGRWAYFFAPNVKSIYCLEPSNAIDVAKSYLNKFKNIIYIKKSIKEISIPDNSIDFCYCLGVLHHTLETEKNLNILVNKLKSKSPLLLYIYYNLENRSIFYKFLWYLSIPFRLLISRLPFRIKILITNLIAYVVYYPISRISKLMDILGINSNFMPLSYYKNKSVKILKNDSMDRFGTIIEKRFSKKQIIKMMKKVGLNNITFSDTQPFYCVIGFKE